MKNYLIVLVGLILSFKIYSNECDSKFLESFKYKNKCKNGDSSACNFLSLVGGSTSAAWVGASIDRSSSAEMDKFKKFSREIRDFRKDEYAKLQEAFRIRNNAIEQASKEAPQSYGYGQSRGTDNQFLLKSIKDRAVQIMNKYGVGNGNPYMVDLAASIKNSMELYPASAFAKYDSRMRYIMNKYYPAELNDLDTLRKTHLPRGLEDWEKGRKNFDAAVEFHPNSKIISLLDSLRSSTTVEHEAFWYQWDSKKARPYKSSEQRKELAQKIKDVKKDLKLKSGARLKSSAAAAGAAVASLLVSGKALASCKDKFNFSDADITFLTTRASGIGAANFSCDGLGLTDPDDIDEIIDKEGELSQGLCNLVKQQNNYFDLILSPEFKSIDLNCESFNAESNHFKVSFGSGLFKFEDTSSGLNVEAPVYQDRWPDFNNLIVNKGEKDSLYKTTQFKDKYKILHSTSNWSNAGKSHQQIDVENACATESVLNCNLIKAASSMNRIISTQKLACDNGQSKEYSSNEKININNSGRQQLKEKVVPQSIDLDGRKVLQR